jgi:type I restriction enzyme R subunit
MYVDKKLRGLNCVQTLSRLNRTCSGKVDTFVLDFVNDVDSVRDSFQPYYTTTEVESITDPNQLYDLQSKIDSVRLFTDEERDRVCEIFLDESRMKSGEFIPIVDRVVDRWKDLKDEEERGDFRSNVKSFLSSYGYISQITDFNETEWEKLSIFLRPLLKKLWIKEPPSGFDLFSSVDLEYFRLQKEYEGGVTLIDEKGILPEVFVGGSKPIEEEEEFLSEIIKIVNDRFGTEFTNDDRTHLKQLLEKVKQDEELERIHLGDNSPTNKKESFNEVIDQTLTKMVNTNLEFYKKVKKDSDRESTLVRLLYLEYLRSKGFEGRRVVGG